MKVIGIDPDLKASGVAVVCHGEIEQLLALDFFALQQFIDEHKDSAIFALEDVESNKSLYAKHDRKKERVRERIAQNVGQVKAVARLIQQYLDRTGAQYQMIKPLKGRFKLAKGDSTYFNRLTGWVGQSSEDKRDAALIAMYGARVSFMGKQ